MRPRLYVLPLLLACSLAACGDDDDDDTAATDAPAATATNDTAPRRRPRWRRARP